ncbi:ribonuclease Z [Tuberibacillus calidus]|uniref:ribonuclease Z n=1 Tax=Tuberibacillus calidus TaxID=340097 RepID=UPI000405BB0E|nr:ribonuclease Z [Tuberibacillus calidus]
MELIFLGTGAGMPSKPRNVSALALMMPEYNGDVWLFDCGEATQHQILRTNIKLSKLTKIFISHLHGDHIFGLPGLLASRSQQGESLLQLYGPEGLKDFVEWTLKLSHTHLTYPLEVVEVKSGQVVCEQNLSVSAAPLDHVVCSFGFRIVEADKPGALLVDKIQTELGIAPGPIYKRFKEAPSVVLPDGRTVNTTDYIGPPKKGRVLTVISDTRPTPQAIELAKNADVLVHEATFTQDREEGANAFGHSTARQAAEIARKAGVGKLILTHISSRYREKEPLLEEATAVFPNTVIAEDFWSFSF